MVGRGKGPKGFDGGKFGSLRSFASSAFVHSRTAAVSATSARYCASVSFNPTEGECLKAARKLLEHCSFEIIIAFIDDRQYSICGPRVEFALPPFASTSRLSPPSSH